VIPLLQKKLGLDDEKTSLLRFYQAHNGKVYKELTNTYTVASVNEFVQLYAESTPEDEAQMAEEDVPIFAFHFNKEPNKIHGVPFKFILRPVSLEKSSRS
jgi:ubiquitin carboxyl-terminal hydrolase 7